MDWHPARNSNSASEFPLVERPHYLIKERLEKVIHPKADPRLLRDIVAAIAEVMPLSRAGLSCPHLPIITMFAILIPPGHMAT